MKEKTKREVDDKTMLDKFVEEFCFVVDKHCKYIICSGFVAIASGRSRGTEDIDMIIEKLNYKKFSELHKELTEKGFVCIQSDFAGKVFDYLNSGISVRYVWKSEGHFPPEMEVKFAKDEFDEEQINSRMKLPLTGLDVYFSSIEGNIAYKEEMLASDKDLEDAKHLRIVYSDKISEDKIDEVKSKIKKYRKNGN